MSDQADLIAKLSEATVGSRELDRELAERFGWKFHGNLRFWMKPDWWTPLEAIEGLPHFTTSVDATLALIEKRLPGWSPSIVKVLHEPVWMGEVVSPDLDEDDISEVGADGSAATPALALCIAILNALQDQQIDAALKPEGGET